MVCCKKFFVYKGQIISKGLLVSSNSPKKTNQRIHFRYYDEFVFWENSRTPKSPFEIIRPLQMKVFITV